MIPNPSGLGSGFLVGRRFGLPKSESYSRISLPRPITAGEAHREAVFLSLSLSFAIILCYKGKGRRLPTTC